MYDRLMLLSFGYISLVHTSSQPIQNVVTNAKNCVMGSKHHLKMGNEQSYIVNVTGVLCNSVLTILNQKLKWGRGGVACLWTP